MSKTKRRRKGRGREDEDEDGQKALRLRQAPGFSTALGGVLMVHYG